MTPSISNRTSPIEEMNTPRVIKDTMNNNALVNRSSRKNILANKVAIGVRDLSICIEGKR